jgi:hypothetical protein
MDAAFALVQPAASAGADATQMRIGQMTIGKLRMWGSGDRGDGGEKNLLISGYLLIPLLTTQKPVAQRRLL